MKTITLDGVKYYSKEALKEILKEELATQKTKLDKEYQEKYNTIKEKLAEARKRYRVREQGDYQARKRNAEKELKYKAMILDLCARVLEYVPDDDLCVTAKKLIDDFNFKSV